MITAALCFAVTELALDATAFLPRDAQDILLSEFEFRAYQQRALKEADMSLNVAFSNAYDAMNAARSMSGAEALEMIKKCAVTYPVD